MTWTPSSGVRINLGQIAIAGVLIAAPAVVFGAPAFAAPGVAPSPPAVVSAPRPADPPQPPPPPPPGQPTHGEYYNPSDQDDWWVYSGTGSF